MRYKRTFIVLPLLFALVQNCVGQSSDRDRQLESPSHRKLDLPASGGVNYQQQLQRLRQLQSLWQKTPDQNADGGLNTMQKSIAEQMMRQTLKNGDTPKLSDFPPDLISKVMSDPDARRDVQELLQKFQQDGLMPRGNGRSGAPLPGNGGNSRADRSNNQARVLREPNRDRSFGNSLPRTNQSEQNHGEGRNPTQQGTETFGGPNSNPPANPNSGNPSSANRPKQDGDSPLTDSRMAPPSNDGMQRQNGESQADYARRIGDFLDQKLREQKKQIAQQGKTGRFGGPSDRTRTSQNSGDISNQGPRSGSSPPVSISDLLKDFEDLPLEDLADSAGNGTDTAADRRNPTNTASGTGRDSRDRNSVGDLRREAGSSSSRPSGNIDGTNATVQELAEKVRKQEAVQKALQQRGLNSAIQQIVKDAKQDVRKSIANGRGASGGSGSMSEGMRNALLKTLNNLSDDVVEIAKDARFKPSDSRGTGTSQGSTTADRSSGASNRSGQQDSWLGQAKETLNNIAQPSSPPSMPSGSTGSGGPDLAVPDMEFSGGSLFSVFVVLAIAGGILWWMLQSGQLLPQSNQKPRLTPAQIGAIRTRSDVVEAFHLLALDPRHGAEPWWHHQQVRSDMSEKRPANEHSVQELTEVYEQARYLPDDVELNERQLQAAKNAIERCRL